LSLSSSWEGANVSRRCIGAGPYVGWTVFLDRALVNEVFRVAATLGDTLVFTDADFDVVKVPYSRLSKIVADLSA